MKNELLKVVNNDFITKLSEKALKDEFYGEIYIPNKEGNIEIDRGVINEIIKKINLASKQGNLIILDDVKDFLVIFKYSKFIESTSIWLQDRTYHFATLLTTKGIIAYHSEETDGFFKGSDEIDCCNWKDIDYFELFENTERHLFVRLYKVNSIEHIDFITLYFGIYDKACAELIILLLNNIVSCIIKNKERQDSIKEDLETEITKSIKEIEYDNTLSLLDKYCNVYNVRDIDSKEFVFYNKNKLFVLIQLGRIKEALLFINEIIRISSTNKQILTDAYKSKGDILIKKGDLIQALNCYLYCKENYNNREKTDEIIKLKDEVYEKIADDFLTIPLEERKLIFIGNDIYHTSSEEMVTIKINQLPKFINFPIGHPHINEVYACHPLRNNLYLPLKHFQKELFLDRVNEFTYLLQCLGATKIEISSSNSNVTDESSKSNLNTEGNIGNKLIDAKVGIEKNERIQNSFDSSLNIEKKQIFNPIKAPFIPEDVIWFKTELSWQRLANQRLNGNINTHEETITSFENDFFSQNQLLNVDAEVKTLLTKANVKYNREQESCSLSKTKYEFNISVDFQSETHVKESKVSKIDLSNPNIENYIEELMFMLEDDGFIDEHERKVLNRKLSKYGISEEKAIEIENQVMSKLYSEDELKYINELKEVLEDGAITEIEFNILDRYASKFGITTKRKELINNFFIK